MQCRVCGVMNGEGAKFCVRCGAPMKEIAPPAPSSKTGFPIKGIAVALMALVIVLVAGINILLVSVDMYKVNTHSSEQRANMNRSNIIETNSYIYYSTSVLYRVDKRTMDSEKIADKAMIPVASENDGIYCMDSDNKIYYISDKTGTPEKKGECDYPAFNGNVYMDGAYTYCILDNGDVLKMLNSKKYSDTEITVYDAPKSKILKKGVIYNGYAYLLLSNGKTDSDAELIRVRLKDGKKTTILSERISDFAVSGEKLICGGSDSVLWNMGLDGNNAKKISDAGSSAVSSMFSANGFVYFSDKNGMYKMDTSSNEIKEIEGHSVLYSPVSGGIAYVINDSLKLMDYDGNSLNPS